MAESHRRVEPRGIVGTGMATDPDRIRDIEQRAARMERDYKLPHKRFGEVMDGNHTPGLPSGTEWVDAPVERQRRTRPGATPPPDARAKADANANAPAPPDGKANGNTPAPVDLDGGAAGTPAAAAQGQAPQAAPQQEPKPEPPQKGPRTRPMAGAANAKVGSSLGGRARVAFKV